MSNTSSEPMASSATALLAIDLAAVLFILDRTGPATHHEIHTAYVELWEFPRLTAHWLRYAVEHLHRAGYVTFDPIAGRGARGRKARRWKLATPLPATPPPTASARRIMTESEADI